MMWIYKIIQVLALVSYFATTGKCITISSLNQLKNLRLRQNLPNLIPTIPIWKRRISSLKSRRKSSVDKRNLSIQSERSQREEIGDNNFIPSKPDEVKWRDCSAKKIKAYLSSDVTIRCEMWAPLGSTIIWSKNGKELSRTEHPNLSNSLSQNCGNTVYQSTSGTEIMEDTGIEIHMLESNNYKFYLMSILHLDCIKSEDQGLYGITIETPAGHKYKRTFLVQRFGTGTYFRFANYNCWMKMYLQMKDFDPRITEFAKKIVGKIGHELTLPCRPAKLNGITITWDKTDRNITADDYSVTSEGDLKIHCLSSQDQGMYTCQTSDSGYHMPYDQIITYVEVQE